MNPCDTPQAHGDIPKHPYNNSSGANKGDGFDFSAVESLAMTLDVATPILHPSSSSAHTHSPTPTHSQTPTPILTPSSSPPVNSQHAPQDSQRAPPSEYVDPNNSENQQGYALYSNSLNVFSPMYAPQAYTPMPSNYHEPSSQADIPTPLMSSTADIRLSGHISQPIPPPIPTIYSHDALARGRPTKVKRRGHAEDDEDVARPQRRGRAPLSARRSHQFFSRSLAKRLSNEEEYEIMDYLLMKKIEELNVLKEALQAGLISQESFNQKQLHFLEAFPFE